MLTSHVGVCSMWLVARYVTQVTEEAIIYTLHKKYKVIT